MADDVGTCVVFHPPAGRRDAKWAMAFRVAAQIVDGCVEAAIGAFMIRADIAYELGHPAELEPLVCRAINLDAWEESWGVSFE
ncbi:hypothetical protein OS965_04465 [Streptomyces sp. H27-G5]|uniref:hypothetical protein n=1 Tax=Streptomyces sp. H27-G5 TaxID=2996698 RepID=UPI00226E4B8F|nr:hypothetical protein [Streptomyces sp. H27-G5]MCY0917432.1 hypothetical protein [Streptomyces sp. H27-G5]